MQPLRKYLSTRLERIRWKNGKAKLIREKFLRGHLHWSTTCSMPELKDFASSVAIIVSSCDAFLDAWRPFVFFFRKHWSDCPFPIFLIVNRLRVRSNFLQPITVGPDRNWASNMQVALAQIAQPYILYLQEDYFLNGSVKRGQLASDFAYAFDRDAASFCFYGRSKLERDFLPLNDRFGIVPRDSDGRTRLQVTLWKKDVLQSTLRPGESAWNMEARASGRTRDLLALSYMGRDNVPIPYLMSAISRRLWTPQAISLCQSEHLRIHPRFRLEHSDVAWCRRLRRGLGRARLALALARQGNHEIDLDAPYD
ncbi:MAG TPA: hypothetical protein VF345_04720 [Chthoniobacterales bacterium]